VEKSDEVYCLAESRLKCGKHLECIMTNAPPSDHRAVSETRFRFVMIVFAIVWALQALLLVGLLYGVTVRVERLEYKVGSFDSKPVPTRV
jgi:hypothetical protein